MATDEDIRAAVYKELVTDQLIDADDIDVNVIYGIVSLNGTVPAQAQIPEATAAARRAAGVDRVDNLLEVAPFG
jgi:osmotically-inducible protein OsmY